MNSPPTRQINHKMASFFKKYSMIYSSAESLTRRFDDMSSPVRAEHWWVYVLHQIKKEVEYNKKKILATVCVFKEPYKNFLNVWLQAVLIQEICK